MREINEIIVHHSESEYGDADTIRRWHVEGNGWSDIGYHYIIGNAYPTWESFSANIPVPKVDGRLQQGRPLDEPGAHAKGHNTRSIGICLIGNATFTGAQIHSLAKLLADLKQSCPGAQILGHCEVSEKKPTCPTINMNYVRSLV
jgi:hypothetical protein